MNLTSKNCPPKTYQQLLKVRLARNPCPKCGKRLRVEEMSGVYELTSSLEICKKCVSREKGVK